jgi:lipopolysaccharide transport system permease protein
MSTTDTAADGLAPLAGPPPAPARRVLIRPSRALLQLDLRALWEARELLYAMIQRELQVRYKQAAIGAAWAVLQPIMAVAIFALIFGKFAKMPSGGKPYLLFAFAAVLPWTFFAEAARRGSIGLVVNGELIRKIYFPRLILPLAMVLAGLADFLVALVLLALMMAWHHVAPTANILMLPVFVLIAVALALAVSLWLGPICVRYRDVAHALPFVIQIWMYASPVAYPASIVPERWRLLYNLNPMVGVIEGFRWAVLGSDRPDLTAIAVSTGMIVLALAAGLILFNRMEGSFADVI